jgi:uncharacterized RDD family membrane protein YckC
LLYQYFATLDYFKKSLMDEILDAPATSERKYTYAGFWIRVGASFLDGILLSIINAIISYAFLGGLGNPSTIAIYYIISLVIGVAYHCVMESSEKQATLGKMAVGIKVGDVNGSRISFGQALARYFSKIISALILFIGFMMVGWDDKKQGLHDKIANTFVYYSA